MCTNVYQVCKLKDLHRHASHMSHRHHLRALTPSIADRRTHAHTLPEGPTTPSSPPTTPPVGPAACAAGLPAKTLVHRPLLPPLATAPPRHLLSSGAIDTLRRAGEVEPTATDGAAVEMAALMPEKSRTKLHGGSGRRNSACRPARGARCAGIHRILHRAAQGGGRAMRLSAEAREG